MRVDWQSSLDFLPIFRVSHILNVTREIDNFFPEHFTYMNVRIYDEEASQLLPYWKETHNFISDVRWELGIRMIVIQKHGWTGMYCKEFNLIFL